MGEDLRGRSAPRRYSYEAIFSEKPMPPNVCKHRYMDVSAIVFRGLESGYVARCLLCETVGPVGATTEIARLAFLEGQGRDKK
jgi:hypothetical protein